MSAATRCIACLTIFSINPEIGLTILFVASLAAVLRKFFKLFQSLLTDSRLMLFSSYLTMAKSIMLWKSKCVTENLLFSCESCLSVPDTDRSSAYLSVRRRFVVSGFINAGLLL